MQSRVAFASLLTLAVAPAIAHADDVAADPNDPGKVTAIHKGVKEIDLGGIFVLSYDKSGEVSNTRISTLGGAGFQYFISNNFSAGASFLFNYDKVGDTQSSTAFGGTAFATLHVRLGLGAFLRPTFGVGALLGTQEIDSGGGMVTELSQTAVLVRIGMPFAYFPSRRVVLQAGPELNISLGNVKPKEGGGDSVSYTSVAGGFGVGVGYVF